MVLPAAVQGRISYTLISALGARVGAGTLTLNQLPADLALDFSSQLPAAGLYYVRLEGKNLNAQLKIALH